MRVALSVRTFLSPFLLPIRALSHSMYAMTHVSLTRLISLFFCFLKILPFSPLFQGEDFVQKGSVRTSVRSSIRTSVRLSVHTSVRSSVRTSVRSSVRSSVRTSVRNG